MRKLLVLSGFITTLVFVQIAHATAVPKITWCHVTPSGNQETLELPQQALENAGHMDANGNPLHAGDHPGACEEPTPTPPIPCDEKCDPTPTPTLVISPTSSPSASPTPSQGVTDAPKKENGFTDDHLGCGMHSCGVDNRSGQPILPPSQSGK